MTRSRRYEHSSSPLRQGFFGDSLFQNVKEPGNTHSNATVIVM